MNITFKKALVTGGAGFIGSHLVEALVAEKCRVAVLDNLSSGNLSNLEALRDRIAFHRGDIRQKDILEKALGNTKALELMKQVFNVSTVSWRGVGEVVNSGLKLRGNYGKYDAMLKFPIKILFNNFCRGN